MLIQATARDVLAAAMKTGGDFAEIFYEDRLNHNMVMRSNQVESVTGNRLHGAGVRVFSGVFAVYVYTNDTSREGLLRCAERAAAAVTGQAAVAPVTLRPYQEAVNIHPIAMNPSDVKGALKIEKMRAVNAAARRHENVSQVLISYMDSEQHVIIANSDGLFTGDTRVYTRIACNAVAGNGTENQTGSSTPGAMMGFELFDSRVNPDKVGDDAGRTASLMLTAPFCPAGQMPVVIDNGFGGVVFHEACGHSLEATSVGPGTSEFTGKLGMTIANERVTAIDDGTMPNEWGSENVDDEGFATTRLVLIEKGVLKNYMIDRLGSRRMNMPVTGSSRRQSYAFAPTSRMRNTFIAAGQDDEDEMIRTMGDGLYAKKMGGGSVNPATGEFNFAVDEGYLVRDGKIAHPVRGASLIGRGSEILTRIDRVGHDMQMAQGMCGSLSGSVPTNVGQPMIRVSNITVGGR